MKQVDYDELWYNDFLFWLLSSNEKSFGRKLSFLSKSDFKCFFGK